MITLENSQDAPPVKNYCAPTLDKEEVEVTPLKKLQQDYLALKSFHNVLAAAAIRQYEMLIKRQNRIQFLERCVENLETLLETNKEIMRNALEKQNEDNITRNQEIIDMKKRQRKS